MLRWLPVPRMLAAAILERALGLRESPKFGELEYVFSLARFPSPSRGDRPAGFAGCFAKGLLASRVVLWMSASLP